MKEVGLESVVWFLVAYVNDQWRILLKMVMNLWEGVSSLIQTVFAETFRGRVQMACHRFMLTRPWRVTDRISRAVCVFFFLALYSILLSNSTPLIWE